MPIPLPNKKYDFVIRVGCDRDLQSFVIEFFRPMDTDVAKDILDLRLSAIEVVDMRNTSSVTGRHDFDFYIKCGAYNTKEVAENVFVYLETEHKLIGLRQLCVWDEKDLRYCKPQEVSSFT